MDSEDVNIYGILIHSKAPIKTRYATVETKQRVIGIYGRIIPMIMQEFLVQTIHFQIGFTILEPCDLVIELKPRYFLKHSLRFFI